MVQFNFNAFQHDPEGGGGVIEPGRYPVQIVETAIKPTKTGGGTKLEITFRIATGPMMGRKILENYNIQNQNATAVQIAMNELAAIGIACGVPQIADTQQWHGRPLIIDIIEEERADGKGKANRIAGYFDVNGVAPTKNPASGQGGGGAGGFQPQQQAPAQNPAQPQQNPAQQQPPAGGAAPWQGQPAQPATGAAPWDNAAQQPATGGSGGAAPWQNNPAGGPGGGGAGGSVPPWQQG